MLKQFNQKQSPFVTEFDVQELCNPSINFADFARGIDNVHIDVVLSPDFTELCTRIIYELLNEHSSTKKRATDEPSLPLRNKLEILNANYASMLTATIHGAAKNIHFVQLFQIAVIKFVLSTVRTQADRLLHNLRKINLKENLKKLNSFDRFAWLNKHKNNLLYRITHEVFEQIYQVESDVAIRTLCQSLLGTTWTLPEKIFSNPLLQSRDSYSPEVLMKNYVLLFEDTDNAYSLQHLSPLIDKLLDEVAYICQLELEPCRDKPFIDKDRVTNIHFSWKEVPANIDSLFNLQETQNALKKAKSHQKAALTSKLRYQRLTNKMLEQNFGEVIVSILAAYETPHLYDHYAKQLKPKLLYQALCQEVELADIALKLKLLRRSYDKDLSINELKSAKKRVARLAQKPDPQMLIEFLTHFVSFQRDLKYCSLIHEVMESINLLFDKTSQINNSLYEFV